MHAALRHNFNRFAERYTQFGNRPYRKAALMHENLMIVHKHNKPYGIRDSTGFLFFFTDITKYPGQESRYREEVFEQYELADFLLNALRGRAAENQGAVAEQRITAVGP